MYKPLKKRAMSQHSGPLSKMIDKEVETRMSALRKTEQEEYEEGKQPVYTDWMETKREQVEGGTRVTEGRTGTTPGEEDTYTGELAPDDEWAAFLETPKGIEYTKKHSPQEIEETRNRFIADIEKVQPKEFTPLDPITSEEKPTMDPVQREETGTSLATFFGKDPGQAGSLSSHAKDYFNIELSSDNPVMDFVKDDKFMKKARKEYSKTSHAKAKPRRGGITMPFERWMMQHYKPKGADESLIEQAKSWEGENATDTDYSGEAGGVRRDIGGAKDTAEARYSDKDWTETGEREKTGGQPATQFKAQSHILKGRSMSFRNKK